LTLLAARAGVGGGLAQW